MANWVDWEKQHVGPLDPTPPAYRNIEKMMAEAYREGGEKAAMLEQSVEVRSLRLLQKYIMRYNARFTEEKEKKEEEMTEEEKRERFLENAAVDNYHVTVDLPPDGFLLDEETERFISEFYEKHDACELSGLDSGKSKTNGKELVEEEDCNRGLEGRKDEKVAVTTTENESLEHLKENVAIHNTSSTKELEPTGEEEDKDFDTILVESVPELVSEMDLEASRKNKPLKNADYGGTDEYTYETMKKPRTTWV